MRGRPALVPREKATGPDLIVAPWFLLLFLMQQQVLAVPRVLGQSQCGSLAALFTPVGTSCSWVSNAWMQYRRGHQKFDLWSFRGEVKSTS